MNATNARGTTNNPAPQITNGVLVRGVPANCNICLLPCYVGGNLEGEALGYYTHNKDKLCKVCAKRKRII